MELKKAVAICLIALVSATLVLLIARALDLQTASRLEPQLARIVEELEAIRKSGGIAPAPNPGAAQAAADDVVMVYYFHGNVRCATCRAIESQTHETVESDFASQLESGEVVWKILNYEQPAGAALGEKFKIEMPNVVVARMSGEEIEDWRRLDEVWALVGEPTDFAELIRSEISRMLESGETKTDVPADADAVEPPVTYVSPPHIPVPQTVEEPNPLRGREEIGQTMEEAGEAELGGSPAELDSVGIPVPVAPSEIPVPE